MILLQNYLNIAKSMVEDMKKTRKYEGLFIIDPDQEETIETAENSIKTIVNENTGSIVEEKKIGKKRLTYPIKKKAEGIYYELALTADPLAIEKITQLCNINTMLLRSIINVT